MFLATTALEEFWDKSQTILFLGEWCRLHSRRHVWSNLAHEVLQYHWNDRRRLCSDFQYIDRVYESTLTSLSQWLNGFHNVDHSPRYWRIVLGPWLRYFSEILYDRYLSISSAASCGKVSSTWIPTHKIHSCCIPNDFSRFGDLVVTDRYNFYLYSAIIEFGQKIPFEFVDSDPWTNRDPRPPETTSRNKSIRRSILNFFGNATQQFNSFFFVSSYFAPLDLTRLSFSLGQFPNYHENRLVTRDFDVDLACRQANCSIEPNDEFVELLGRMLLQNIPRIYLEGYSSAVEQSMRIFPKNPRIIFTDNSYSSNEGFKLWCASTVEKGTILVVGQHGGHDGSAKLSSSEDHETTIADRYISWGWEKGDSGKVIRLPAQKLIRQTNRSTRFKKCIFWNLNGSPRYTYRLFSVPLGPTWLEYIQMQIDFAKCLTSEVKDAMRVRPYMRDFGWDIVKRIGDEVSGLWFDLDGPSWGERMSEASMAVETTNTTTFLESMAANIPTIAFWNPEHWGLRDSAQPAFNRLRKEGILHPDAVSAANAVNAIFEDPQMWWSQRQIQEAREEFCMQFAYTSPSWLDEWKTEFLRLLDEQRVSAKAKERDETPRS